MNTEQKGDERATGRMRKIKKVTAQRVVKSKFTSKKAKKQAAEYLKEQSGM